MVRTHPLLLSLLLICSASVLASVLATDASNADAVVPAELPVRTGTADLAVAKSMKTKKSSKSAKAPAKSAKSVKVASAKSGKSAKATSADADAPPALLEDLVVPVGAFAAAPAKSSKTAKESKTPKTPKSTKSAAPAGKSSKTAKESKSTKSAAPGKSSKTAKESKTAKSDHDHGKTAKTSKTSKTAKTSKSAKTSKTSKTAKSSKSSKTAKTSKSSKHDHDHDSRTDSGDSDCVVCKKGLKVKFTSITLKYNSVGADDNNQAAYPYGDLTGTFPPTVEVRTSKGPNFAGTVSDGDHFTISSNGKFNAWLELKMSNNGGSVGKVGFHTSCSIDITLGDKFGPFEIISTSSMDAKPGCNGEGPPASTTFPSCADTDGDGVNDDSYACPPQTTLVLPLPTTSCGTATCSDAQCCKSNSRKQSTTAKPESAPRGKCKSWCAHHEVPWFENGNKLSPKEQGKCAWTKNCGGCPECYGEGTSAVCESWCGAHAASSEEKCLWVGTCAGCSECLATTTAAVEMVNITVQLPIYVSNVGFDTAVAVCDAVDARLCSSEEIRENVGSESTCLKNSCSSLNNELIWTSEYCGSGNDVLVCSALTDSVDDICVSISATAEGSGSGVDDDDAAGGLANSTNSNYAVRCCKDEQVASDQVSGKRGRVRRSRQLPAQLSRNGRVGAVKDSSSVAARSDVAMLSVGAGVVLVAAVLGAAVGSAATRRLVARQTWVEQHE